jgi:hypothetical protein
VPQDTIGEPARVEELARVRVDGLVAQAPVAVAYPQFVSSSVPQYPSPS